MEKRSSTAVYAAVNGSYWASFCLVYSFAEVYLQAVGYSNTELGWVLAVGSSLGALIGPALSSLLDRGRGFRAEQLILLCLSVQAVCAVSLLLSPGKSLLSAVYYSLYLAFCLPINSLSMKLYAEAERLRIPVSYSAARAAGSLCFVLLSFALGFLVKRFPITILLWLSFPVNLLQGAANLRFAARINSAAAVPEAGEEKKRDAGLFTFLKENMAFGILLLGSILIFFSHNLITSFMINVVKNAGGDASSMSLLNAFMAAVEIPVMFFYPRLKKGKTAAALLMFSFAAFSLKAAAVMLAPSVPWLFAALLLQGPSFALYSPTIVDYVETVVPLRDAGKGQSLAYSTTTLGSVAAGLIGGLLYDRLTVTQTLLIGTAVCIAGSFITVQAVRAGRRKKGETYA